MMHPRVTLTWPELLIAGQVGIARQVFNMKNKKRTSYASMEKNDSLWSTHATGACSELAVAKYLNLYWSGALKDDEDDEHLLDVGYMLDVRGRAEHWQDLGIKKKDPDNVPFVHVWAHPPFFDLYGWVYAKEGKILGDELQLKKPDGSLYAPSYFVKRRMLRPIPELVTWVEQQREQQYDAAA